MTQIPNFIVNSISDIVNFAGRHPLLGTGITVAQLAGAIGLTGANLLFIVQIGAYSAPVATFCLFAIGWLKKNTHLLDNIKWLKDNKSDKN